MIKFSWKKINDKFDWNAYSVLEYFYLKRNKKIPGYLHRSVPKRVIKEAKKPLIDGPCFLLDIDSVLINANTPHELYTYLELASKRNVFDYLVRGTKHLPLALVPEYLLKWVKINPMIETKDENVYFKYEQEITE